MLPVALPTLAAYAATVAAIVLSPGPDTALILRHALAGGRGPGLAAVAGVQIGLLGHFTLAALGVSLLIASSPLLFKTVAFLGAAYLAWIGVHAILGGGALKVRTDAPPAPLAPVTLVRAAREAILCNLLNPKVVMLFLGLLPNFVDYKAGNVFGQLVTLTSVLIVINVAWQAPMAFAADTLRRWLADAKAQRRVGVATGAVMIAFAALMVVENLL